MFLCDFTFQLYLQDQHISLNRGGLPHKFTEPEDMSPTFTNHWPAFRDDRKVQLKLVE